MIWTFVWIFIAVPTFVLAAAPFNIVLSYDSGNEVLHISAKHPTDRLERYFVRNISIFKNELLEKEIVLHRQKLPTGIEEDVPLKAAPEDRLRVVLKASEGGVGEAELVIPKDALGEDIK